MLSKLLFTLFATILVLQSVTALPTRGSLGQMQRRASKVARGPRQTQPAFLQRRGASQLNQRTVKPTKNANQKRAASIAKYVAALGRRDVEDAHVVAALAASATEAAPTFAPTAVPAFASNPKAVLRANAVKAAAIGNQYTDWEQAAGAPTATSAWVAASNVTLPSAIAKRTAKATPALNRRMVPHPGAPTGTIKINVAGGPSMAQFTLLNATSSATETRVAATSQAVNIVQNITSVLSSLNALPTVTETITFTAPESKTQTATVVLVPTLLPNATAASYVPASNATNPVDCSIPVNATMSEAGNSAVTVTCGQTSVEVNVQVDASVSVNADKKEESKRDTIAFFEAPAASPYSKEAMLSDDWEDCVMESDEGCMEVPEY